MTMSVEEAYSVLSEIDFSKRLVINDGGQSWKAMRIVRRLEEAQCILNGEDVPTGFLSEKEVKALKKALDPARCGKMTIEEAKKGMISYPSPVDPEDEEEGSRTGFIDPEAVAIYSRAKAVESVLDPGSKEKIDPSSSLSSKEMKVLSWIAQRTKKMIDKADKKAAAKRKGSFWKRLFGFGKKKEFIVPKAPKEVFSWKRSANWGDVTFQDSKTGMILFSHRLNVSKFTPKQREAIKKELAEYQINVTERVATSDNGDIKKGDITLRVSDKESIERLREVVLLWAQPKLKPIEMTMEEYRESLAKKMALLRSPVALPKEGEKPVTRPLDMAARSPKVESR